MKQLLVIIMAASISLGGCVCLGAGWVYEFDGVDDYVATSEGVDVVKLTTQFTVSAWLNPTAISTTTETIAGKYETSLDNRSWFVGVIDDGGYKVQAFFGDPANGTFEGFAQTDSAVIGLGVFQHVSVVYSAGVVVFYVDGVEMPSSVLGGTIPATLYQSTKRARVGAIVSAGLSNFITGQMHAVEIRNRALTAAECRGLYKAGGGRNDFGNLSIVLPRADDQSLVFSLDRPVTAASTGDMLATDAVITSKDAARNYGLAIGGVTVGPAAIALPAP